MNLFTSNEVKIKLNYNHIWIDHPLFVKLLVNDRVLNFDISGEPNKNIEKKLNLDNELHELKIQITGKNDQNTSIDQQGKIIQDSFIEITDLQFDNISVLNMLKNETNFGVFVSNDQNILTKTANFGYNGTLTIPFKVPIYNWLLGLVF